jgi:uncharacterized RDD family membrane protein YckC
MKCPKCEYLGFETGDRCKNCGYDFALLLADDPMPDLDLRTSDEMASAPESWLDFLNRDVTPAIADDAAVDEFEADEAVAEARGTITEDTRPEKAVAGEAAGEADLGEEAFLGPAAPAGEPAAARFATTADSRAVAALPLFTTAVDGDDAPLIKLPAKPRAPLAVRRTPEAPRLRNIPKAVEKEPEPELEFGRDPEEPEVPVVPIPSRRPRVTPARRAAALTTSGPVRRLLAAAIDNGILLAIDLGVLYFTLKMAALPFAEWRQVPMMPLLTFLLLLKFAYFSAFTAVGGQTIGKMGAGIRVIADDDTLIDPARALKRTLAAAVSLVTLGAAFAPALFGADGRALHDRVARTRVVDL